MSEVVRSAARVLDLLEFFSESGKEANLAAISQAFHLPKSSALGLLRTLCARGYLDKDEQGIYRLNETFRSHGFNWGGARLTQLLTLAKPVMASMASELEETVTLGVLTAEGKIRLVHQALTSQTIRYEMSLSMQLPVHCTAMGRMYLAVKSAEERQALLARYPVVPWTKYTVTDARQLELLINEAGARNYSISADEVDIGGTGVCTPIRDAQGEPVAMLNVSCVSARFSDKKTRIIKAVLEEGKKLTDQLSG
ncbi:IclR family transcriptional regulator [Erwiniaceae bacterium L1_54_6]|jgi:IclR family transcriptional regulator, pca regulon regulatory protein|nr:IclR family transcriptional regulator [Erwiniaceae bacterium L1_54_6]